MNKSYSKQEKEHLKRIKEMSCIVCQTPPPSSAHHVKQDTAYYCIPLCHDCHQGEKNGIHGGKAMWKIHKMDEIDAMALLILRITGR